MVLFCLAFSIWMAASGWSSGAAPGSEQKPSARLEAVKTEPHWSLQLLHKPVLPPVKDHAWVCTPIDQFVLAKLEEKGIHPSPAADKRTLLRRIYFDLIG